AISMLEAAGKKGELSEVYGVVIENVKKDTLSKVLKSEAYTGNPAAGSVEFKRFVNSSDNEYGTARRTGKGNEITAPPITVNLDTHREIVEEIAKFDLKTFGVANIMARRASNHIDTMSNVLDRKFFKVAADAATAITPKSTEPIEQLEEMIVALETVKNEYVQGVKRNMINAVVTPEFFSDIRKKLDTLPSSNVDTAAEDFGTYHGVKVFSGINLPDGVTALTMIHGAVGQPAVIDQYGEPEKIPMSNDYSVSLFYDFGTKALTPDLIFKLEDKAEDKAEGNGEDEG
ncbi:MAG: hypothetical protein K2N36_01190, partial [Ruminiclostridium sp.]|nr:hypothetical protein [Ruminiclostridium sp.]